MFTNYWYFIALGAMFSVITKTLNDIIFASLFFIWLLYLFYIQRITFMLLFATFLSFVIFYVYIPSLEKPHYEEETTSHESFYGKIVSPLDKKSTSLQFTFQPARKEDKILVIYFFEEDESFEEDLSSLKYGARCKISGELSVPNSARNPHQFDYQQYLLKNGITYQLIVQDLSALSCKDETSLEYIFSLRELLIELASEKLRPETAAWLQALVLGYDELIDDDTIKLFQRWSLSHILAISGLHIGIVVAIIYMIFVRFSITTKETAQTFIVIFLPIYAFLAGGEPSVWRASLMVVLGILLIKLNIKLNYTDIISIVFLILIFINPYIVYHIGFQFSFLVSFGLILSQKWLSQTKSNLFRIFQISFIAQMVILPLQVNYFYNFQPLSILLNVIVVPYFSLIVIPLSFLLLLFIYVPEPVIQFVEKLFLFIHDMMLTFIDFVDTYLYFPMLIGTFPTYAVIIYYVFLIFFMKFLEKENKKQALLHAIAICLLLTLLVVRPYFSPVGTVTMLDIGQGDAFIIELPYRKGVFLIDAGARFSYTDFRPTETVYEQIIRPYLYGQGIGKIDAIFITHGDLDHNGSVNFIIDEFAVKEVIISNFYEMNEEEIDLWTTSNILVTRANAHKKLVRNGQDFYILAPERDRKSENENSLVLYTKLGGMIWLFTGDIDKEGEREIVKNFPQLQVDILKVAHHGSNTSTDEQFIKTIQPTYALISAGLNNRFGHPTKEVIDTFEKENIHVYRTDIHGAVQFKFREDDYFITTFLPEK